MFLDPFLLGLVGGLGAALGEFTGYGIGFGGRKLIEKKWKKDMNKTEKLFQKYGGFLIILLFAATPLPDDIVGILGGSLGYPAKKFFVATLIGKIILHWILAYGGFYGVNWVLDMFASFS
jgi:membrane protein DedA with SNARE-associated domain